LCPQIISPDEGIKPRNLEKIVESFLARKIDANKLNNDGKTPYMIAIKMGHMSAAQLLETLK
jgi:ankyrin repeat protein